MTNITNIPNILPSQQGLLKSLMAWGLTAAICLMVTPTRAQLTDLANAPLTNGGAIAVKPNIMLLLDTSNSMKRSHMPDDLETTAALLSLGYKSPQCNVLFYNPTQTYQIPRFADGTQYPTPGFNAARYDGFDALSALVDLSSAFRAYDNSTRQNAVGADPAKAAYYYLHSSGATFATTTAPCTDVDTDVSKVATTSPTGVTGNWVRKLVSTTSGPGATDELQNFAIWYSYYRVRINLAKSALSLAFTPLTDSYRIGFIAVLPNVALDGTGPVSSSYYLPISDFNATQRTAWFNKVFSQTPRGSSPTRQGLARVGRHYAGQTDGINDGMPEDPIQYSCQQNFVIATTDGYWNTAAETAGPVKIDGTTRVGQQDGDLSDPNSPRPIWDGMNDNTRIVTDKSNQYSFGPCTGSWFSMATLRTDKSTTQIQKITTQILQSTNQNLMTSVQNFFTDTQNRRSTAQTTQSTAQNLSNTIQRLQSSVQNLRSTLRTRQSTLQNLTSTSQILATSAQVTQSTSQTVKQQTQRWQRVDQIQKTSAQVEKSTTQNLQSTVQNRQTSVQNLQSTVQILKTVVQIGQTIAQTTQSSTQNLQSTVSNRQTQTQNLQSTVQVRASTAQINVSTSQINTSTAQINQTQTQLRQSTSQILSCSSITEICTPVASCTTGGAITCSTVLTGPTLVATCTAAAAAAGNTYTTTTCAPTVVGPTPVGACAVVAPVAGNAFTATTCNTVVTGPTPSSSCVAAAASSGNTWTTKTCNTIVTGPTPVGSCSPAGASGGNSQTATTCTTVPTGPTPVSSCASIIATAGNAWTTTTCSNNNTTNVGVSTCTPSAATAGNSWTTTTCGTNNFTNQPVATCTPQVGGAGNAWLTISCPAAVTTTNVAVQTCAASAAAAGNGWTTTTCGTNNLGPTGVSSCTTQVAAVGNSWVTITCGNGNSGPTGVAACTPQVAAAGNSWIGITCPPGPMQVAFPPNTPVASCSPAAPTAGNAYQTITCPAPVTTSNVPVSACVASAAAAGNSYVTTTCANTGANNYANTPVLACVASPGVAASWITISCPAAVTTANVPVLTCTPAAAAAGNSYTTTTCPAPLVTANVPVQTCAAAAAAAGNSWVATSCAFPPANNFAGTPVAVCTPQVATAGNNWITITCSTVNITPPFVIDPSTCAVGAINVAGTTTTCFDVVTVIPSATCVVSGPTLANSWTTTTCPGPILTGPTPKQTCVASGPTAANSFTTTTCANPAATNFIAQPAPSCTPQAAAAGNSWITITCPAPVTTGPTPTAACAVIAAGAGNAYTATSCTTAVTGPTAVDPATCPLGAARSPSTTGGALSPFIYVTCTAQDTSLVPVSTCTPAIASGVNSWTDVTCFNTGGNNYANTPVASCTPSGAPVASPWITITCPAPISTVPAPVASCTAVLPVAGNTFTETVCTTNNTGPVGVAACAGILPVAGNGFTTTTCGAVNTTNVNIPIPCVASAAAAGNLWVTTTCPAPVVTGPTAITTCTASGPANPVRTCSNPAPNNFANQPVAACVAQLPAAGNSFVKITCPAPIVTTSVPVASCSISAASALNSWVTTTCPAPIVVGPTGVAAGTCTVAAASALNLFTTTACSLVNTGPTPVAACVAALPIAGNSFISTSCTPVTTGPTLTQTCTPTAPVAGNNFTTTTCPLTPGQKMQYATTTSLTTTPYSGGIATTVPVVTTSTAAAAVLDPVCYIAGVDSLPPFPNPGKPGTNWTNGFGTVVAIPPAPAMPCATWPCTTNTNANAGGSSDSLADVAQYYYVTDLRPSLQNNVPATGTGPEDDRATYQHMTTFTIALGVSGNLVYRPDYKSLSATTGDFATIRTGPLSWPFPIADTSTSIDDFWHAAVNGRGQYFSAGNPTTVINGLTSALAGVTARTGSGSAAAPSSQAPSDGDNLTYIASYVTQKWTGQVEAHEIDLTTGGPKTAIVWSAKALLDAKAGNLCDNRNIYLFRSGATNNVVPLTWNSKACDGAGNPTGAATTGLNAAEQANFSAANVALLSQYPSMTDGSSGSVDQRTPAANANLLNFVRGQRGYEDFTANTAGKLYRKRDTILGDITNSAPRYVRGATADYQDHSYDVFAAASSSRIPMVYVASNGGMLHAFRAGTSITDVNGGNEEWAFVPTQVLPNMYKLADNNYANVHVFMADGTPVPSDVYDTSASTWKKILVAGLNGGGKGYYALDVSNPLAPKALWEFNWSNTCYNGTAGTAGADCHIGYTYGKPIYATLTDGTWVVMVTSGYNNVNAPSKVGDGQGYLYVLNAITGKIIYKISTGVGSAAAPSGLGQLVLFVDDSTVSLLALQVYGADLQGNVWRFDINDRIAPSGREAALVGTAKDPSGIGQPITTQPKLLELSGKAMIVVGTGKLLGTTDLSDNQVQSIYAFVDNITAPVANLRTTLAPLAFTQSGADTDPASFRTIRCTGSAAACGTPNGWYVDLPSTGERLVVDPRVELGTFQAATSILSSSACNVGGIGKLINLNVLTGLALPGTAGGQVSKGYLPSLPVGITVLKLPGGAVVSVVADSTGANTPFPFPYVTPGPQGKRITWRELTQ